MTGGRITAIAPPRNYSREADAGGEDQREHRHGCPNHDGNVDIRDLFGLLLLGVVARLARETHVENRCRPQASAGEHQ